MSLDKILRGPGREEIHGVVLRLLSGRVSRQEREVIVPTRERDRHLAVTVVSLPGSLGSAPGALVVVDDLTPLMRAQKIAAWGEVARKLAHEIKNPLTPIQLSAQRVRKAWLKGAPDFERVVTESTRAIVIGSIRAGRTSEQRERIVSHIKDAFARVCGVEADQMIVALVDVPARWVMEGGAIMPEPGQEAAWLEKHAT